MSSGNLKAGQLYICPITLAGSSEKQQLGMDIQLSLIRPLFLVCRVKIPECQFAHWGVLHVRCCNQVKEEGSLIMIDPKKKKNMQVAEDDAHKNKWCLLLFTKLLDRVAHDQK